MSGFSESLNVSVAVGVTLHAIRTGVEGDPSPRTSDARCGPSSTARPCARPTPSSCRPPADPLAAPATTVTGAIFLTGGTGFLGRRLVRELVATGRPVFALVAPGAAAGGAARGPGVVAVDGDARRRSRASPPSDPLA